MDRPILRTFIAYVEDRPGVLNRVSSLFRRRAYNIESLTVGRTHTDGISRMTLMIEANEDGARRLEANLYKLMNVVWVRDITHAASVERDLALIKVRARPENRAQVLQLCDMFRARTVDIASDALIIEISGTRSELDSLHEALRPYGIVEMVRTGIIAMTRGGDTPEVGVETPALPNGERPNGESAVA